MLEIVVLWKILILRTLVRLLHILFLIWNHCIFFHSITHKWGQSCKLQDHLFFCHFFILLRCLFFFDQWLNITLMKRVDLCKMSSGLCFNYSCYVACIIVFIELCLYVSISFCYVFKFGVVHVSLITWTATCLYHLVGWAHKLRGVCCYDEGWYRLEKSIQAIFTGKI